MYYPNIFLYLDWGRGAVWEKEDFFAYFLGESALFRAFFGEKIDLFMHVSGGKCTFSLAY